MAYISKFKGSEVDSILTDVRNSVKPDLTTLKNNLSKSVSDINTEIEEINTDISSISGEISNIKRDLTQANTAINSVTEKAKEIDNKQNTISDLDEDQKALIRGNLGLPSNEYIVSVFEELKQLIKNNNAAGAIAVLDKAILDMHKLQ